MRESIAFKNAMHQTAPNLLTVEWNTLNKALEPKPYSSWKKFIHFLSSNLLHFTRKK